MQTSQVQDAPRILCVIRILFLKAYADRVVATDEKRRLYGKGEENLAPADYLQVLKRKPGQSNMWEKRA